MRANRSALETNGSAKAATFPSPVRSPISQDYEANTSSTSTLAHTAPDPNPAGALPKSNAASLSVERAAMWLADQRNRPAQIIPILKAEFDLSAVQACEAIAMARRMEVVRRAFG